MNRLTDDQRTELASHALWKATQVHRRARETVNDRIAADLRSEAGRWAVVAQWILDPDTCVT